MMRIALSLVVIGLMVGAALALLFGQPAQASAPCSGTSRRHGLECSVTNSVNANGNVYPTFYQATGCDFPANIPCDIGGS